MTTKVQRLNFNKLNPQHVAILYQQLTVPVKKLIEFFQAKNFKVWSGSSKAELFVHLGKEKAGFVFVSAQIDKNLLAQVPGFLSRKYQAPIIIYNENGEFTRPKSLDFSVAMDFLDDVNPEKALDLLKDYQSRYDKRWDEIYGPQIESQLLIHLTSIIKESDTAVAKPNEIELSIYRVLDPVQGGYFVFAFPFKKGLSLPDESLKILKKHIKDSLGSDSILEPIDQRLSWDLFKTLTKNSDRTVVGFIDSQEMIMSYFGSLPENIQAEDIEVIGDRVMIGIEDWWTQLPLNFSAYMWLEKNQRKFIYVKKGDSLSPKALARFKKMGYKKMAIKKDEIAAYKRLRELFNISKKKAS